jgi:ABC-2 type transport system permease protein
MLGLLLFPWKPFQLISPFLPGTAGSKIFRPQGQIDMMSQGELGAVHGPWQGFGVLPQAVVLLTVAAVLLRRRNA